MGRVFSFKAKGLAPHLAVVPPPATEEVVNDLEGQIRSLLFRYEVAEEGKMKLRTNHAEVFDKLDRYEEEQKECKDALKRLLHTKDGPPEQVPLGRSEHIWARGSLCFVSVQYKKRANYYDPELLPKSVFMHAGVVTEVDKDRLNVLAKTDGRIARALKHGEWMTPALSVPRLARDITEPEHQ
jgi:hypothetical protein